MFSPLNRSLQDTLFLLLAVILFFLARKYFYYVENIPQNVAIIHNQMKETIVDHYKC